MFYPRRKPRDVCDDVDPRRMCTARRIEVLNGSFGYDQKREGYYYTEITGPFEIPVILDACPFCHEMLPGHQARKRFFAKLEEEEKKEPKLLPPPPDATGHAEMDCTDGDMEG